MRSAVTLLLALALPLVSACSPEVDIPDGNKNSTSDKPVAKLPAPSIAAPPAKYPFSRMKVTGSAGEGAIRVIVTGAGNPTVAPVQPVDHTFCVDVDLSVSPADYTLIVKSQSGDGLESEPSTVKVTRANDAPPPGEKVTLCDGTAVGE